MIGYPYVPEDPDGTGLGDSCPLHEVGMFVCMFAGERTNSTGRIPKLYTMSPTFDWRPFSSEWPQPIVVAFGCINPRRWYGASQSWRTPPSSDPPVATSLTN